MREDAPQRAYRLRAVFHTLRWFVRADAPWRLLPNDLPPWALVNPQTRRWLRAGVLDAMAHYLRALLRAAAGRVEKSTAAILGSRFASRTSKAAPARVPNRL